MHSKVKISSKILNQAQNQANEWTVSREVFSYFNKYAGWYVKLKEMPELYVENYISPVECK